MIITFKKLIENALLKFNVLIKGDKYFMEKETHPTAPEDLTSLQEKKSLKYPEVNNKFFKSFQTKKIWWVELKSFLVFAILAGLAVFVFYKCITPMIGTKIPSGYLLFYFGVFTIVFAGLVVVALFLIKASVKHRAEQDERNNKILAFRLKMLESAFDLENGRAFAEKHFIEKELSMNERDSLFSLDENQRKAEHNRKMQLKQYEIIENYMKYIVEMAKTGKQDIGNLDLFHILNIINKEEQPAQDDDKTKKKDIEGEGGHGKKTEEEKPEQQAASTEGEEKPAAAEEN